MIVIVRYIQVAGPVHDDSYGMAKQGRYSRAISVAAITRACNGGNYPTGRYFADVMIGGIHYIQIARLVDRNVCGGVERGCG